MNSNRPRRAANPEKFNQLIQRGLEAAVAKESTAKREVYNRKGQLIRTDIISYISGENGEKN